MKNERLILPDESDFYSIINHLDVGPPLGERIDEALRSIEEKTLSYQMFFLIFLSSI